MKQNLFISIFFLSLSIFFLTSFAVSNAAECGSSNGQSFVATPTENLCPAGSTPSVVSGTGPWNWTCTKPDTPCATGDSKVCSTADNCAGKQFCSAGVWGACVKDVATCGSSDYCNSQGQWCDGSTGACENKCSTCACPSDKPTCNTDESCSSSGGGECDANHLKLADGTCAPGWCSDGTLMDRCSSGSLGKQCVVKKDGAGNIIGLELADACGAGCLCPGYKNCNAADNTCVNNGLPESFSWANKDGSNWLSPIRSQGGCGSCYIFAAVAAVEARYNIEHGPNTAPDLSEQEMVSCGNLGGCGGGYSGEVLGHIMSYGIIDESCFPYTGDDKAACVSTCSTKHGFGSFADFKGLYQSVYEYGPLPISNNGNHAVLMIGWTSDGKILTKDSVAGYSSVDPNQVQVIATNPKGTY